MNLFQKYGIKEVADVVFYSINNIGDEELYTPVLYLDTLKVSTLEKSAEKVSAQGGKGNKKLITWNFGKNITLNLEDALFTPASMSLMWGGKLDSKLSPYTSAIVKLRLANKYASLHYSTKAYPSPALTDEEWEIVFKAAEEVLNDQASLTGLKSIEIVNSEATTETKSKYTSDEYTANKDYPFIEENRVKLVKAYFERSFTNSFFVPYTFNCAIYASDVQKDEQGKDLDRKYYKAKKYFQKAYQVLGKEDDWQEDWAAGTINFLMNMTGSQEEFAPEDIDESNEMVNTIPSFWNTIGREYQRLYTANAAAAVPSGVDFEETYKKHIYDMLFKHPDKQNQMFELSLSFEKDDKKAISELIIEKIIEYIDNIKKIGSIETQIEDTEIIDRMEKCIVKDKGGLIINTSEQKKNLLRYYEDDRTSSFCIYYDPKTMLPMLNITDDGFIQGWDTNGVYDKNFNMKTDTDSFVLKQGTIYYKWSRTVKYKNGVDDGILGRTFVIDADTFPDTYKITGETYIRDQKTGKDHRFQFIINRAAVSSDTNITLQAEGDPTTFSMAVDVLTPPNDIMIELKEFDVDEDKKHGGTKVLPERSKYSYTPASIVKSEITTVVNNEIY